MDYEIIRIISAFFAGGLLSLGGSFTQVATQNELAGPSTLGFDGLVVLNILVAHLYISFVGTTMELELLSLFFFALCFLLIKFIVKQKKSETIYTNSASSGVGKIILIGLCFNLFIGAIFSLMHFFFLSKSMEFPVQLWFGNFKYATESSLIILVFTFLGIYSFVFLKRECFNTWPLVATFV
jgi:iron complex transport system permease protein